MGKPLILVDSVTYAFKGRNLLVRMGIWSRVERVPGGCGCGYCIYVPDRTDEAESFLIEKGVPVAGREERREAP